MSRLRDIREKKNYTMAFIADKVGIAYSTLVELEREQQNMSNKLRKRFAELYEVPVETLFPDYVPDEKDEIMTPLRQMREDRGLLLKEVSEATGINMGNLMQIEMGKRGMSGKTAKSLSEFYGVELKAFRLSTVENQFRADVLTDLRKAMGLSMNQLSKKTGIDVSTISLLEGGKQGVPNLQTLQKLGDFFEVEPDEFLVNRKPDMQDFNTWLMQNAQFKLDGETVHLDTPEARERVLNMVRAGVAWEKELSKK